MDPKTTAVSALTALAPHWPAAGAMLDLLRSADFRPDLCEAVAKLVAQAAVTVRDQKALDGFLAAKSSLAALRESEEAERVAEL